MPVAGITAKDFVNSDLFVDEFALVVTASSNAVDFVVYF